MWLMHVENDGRTICGVLESMRLCQWGSERGTAEEGSIIDEDSQRGWHGGGVMMNIYECIRGPTDHGR